MQQEPKPQENYAVFAQTAEQVQDGTNAPAIAIGEHLLKTNQEKLLTSISVYAERGTSRQELRMFYMNAVALRVWREMGHAPTVTSQRYRPPSSAVLLFGVPFSE